MIGAVGAFPVMNWVARGWGVGVGVWLVMGVQFGIVVLDGMAFSEWCCPNFDFLFFWLMGGHDSYQLASPCTSVPPLPPETLSALSTALVKPPLHS